MISKICLETFPFSLEEEIHTQGKKQEGEIKPVFILEIDRVELLPTCNKMLRMSEIIEQV